MKNITYKKYRPFVLLFLMISFCSCALDVPEKGFDYLAPPVITNCSQEGDNIVVQFQGNNDEDYFDGYNVYVSNIYMIRTSVRKYKPAQVEGYASATPSFPLSPEECNPSLTRSITLYQYYLSQSDTGEYIPFPFSSGTYYIMLCSHHRFSGVNEDGVSNQVDIIFNTKK